jgi:IS30 family transposase
MRLENTSAWALVPIAGEVAALAQQVRKLPSELRRSLTWDRGKEMANQRASRLPPT